MKNAQYYIKQVGHEKYAYWDVSGPKNIIRFTNSRVLAYPFVSIVDAQCALAYLQKLGYPSVEIVKQ